MTDQKTEALSARNDIAAASIQMPQYQCHKKVWALQILGVRSDPAQEGRWILSFRDKAYAPITISDAWFERHLQPHEQWGGGYYVTYQDGYTSFSPQLAFEEGYTLLSK